MQGTISKVISAKGFGFIRGVDGHEYFFHMSSLQRTSSHQFADLIEGLAVSFDSVKAEKGPRAINVEVAG